MCLKNRIYLKKQLEITGNNTELFKDPFYLNLKYTLLREIYNAKYLVKKDIVLQI